MALTPTEESQVRALIAQEAPLLSLAGEEPAIISNLGATDVNLSDLAAASSLGDADLLLVRQGATDKSIAGLIVKSSATIPDATDSVKGKVSLAVAANYPSASDTETTTPAYVSAAINAIPAKLGAGYLLVRDEKAAGTAGGSSVVGPQTRVLNTVSANTISGASLASNQITLPAGTYRVHAHAPVQNVNTNKAYLYNVTDTAIIIVGSSGEGATNINSDSFVNGRFVLATSKVIELRHDCDVATATNGLGLASNRAGMVEVYSEVEIIKEA